MDIETAEKVSKLLSEKIEFERDLEKLLSKSYKFTLGTDSVSTWSLYGAIPLNISRNMEFNQSIKVLTIKRLEEEIDRIDKQIKELKC